MVKVKIKKFRFYNEDEQMFQNISYINSWTYDLDDIEKRIDLMREDKETHGEVREWFNTMLHQRGVKKLPKESQFLDELNTMPQGISEQALKGKIGEVEEKLGGEVSAGMFLMELFKPESGFIQHNSHPNPDLSLHYFLRTPIDTIEFLECQHDRNEQGGFCIVRDWSIMGHRLKTETCMVDEETGEELCDTAKNLNSISNKYPYRLLRGKMTNQEKINFLLGQQEQLEMFDIYEEVMQVEGDKLIEKSQARSYLKKMLEVPKKDET